MVELCECNNEPSSSVKDRKLFGELSTCNLLHGSIFNCIISVSLTFLLAFRYETFLCLKFLNHCTNLISQAWSNCIFSPTK
jgi:hypothetical protein